MKTLKTLFFILAISLNCFSQAIDATKSKFCMTTDKAWLTTTVPGTVHTDLLANTKTEDPYYGVPVSKGQNIGDAISQVPFLGAQVFIELGQTPEEIDTWFRVLKENQFSMCRIRIGKIIYSNKHGKVIGNTVSISPEETLVVEWK